MATKFKVIDVKGAECVVRYTADDDRTTLLTLRWDGTGKFEDFLKGINPFPAPVEVPEMEQYVGLEGTANEPPSPADRKGFEARPKGASDKAEDADKNWNALSLPFVVGPKGRIGKLDPAALKP